MGYLLILMVITIIFSLAGTVSMVMIYRKCIKLLPINRKFLIEMALYALLALLAVAIIIQWAGIPLV